MTIEWTADALDDLEHISSHIEEQRTLTLATRICRRIYDTVQVLGRQPALGRAGRVVGTRELVISGTPWLAVDRVRSNVIQIVRILHGAQDWPPSA